MRRQPAKDACATGGKAANMDGFWTALGAITALIAAGSACFAAIFTYRIMRSAQDQVKASREQNQQTLEAERDAQLPVLIPTYPLMSVGHTTQDRTGLAIQPTKMGYDRNEPFVRVALNNVGPGIAVNVWGIIYEPEPAAAVDKVTGQHHSHRYNMPFEPAAVQTEESTTPGSQIPSTIKRRDWRAGGVAVTGDMEVSDGTRHEKLYAPPKPTFADTARGETEKVARITLTYSDIFGRKHAAIYDLTAQMEWENVAYLRNILLDLGEMERETLRRTSPVASPWLSPATSSD